MPLSTNLTKSKAKVAKKPVTILPNKVKTLPKIPINQVSSSETFQKKLNKSINDIEIDTEDLPEDLQDVWDDLDEDELKDTFAKKNLALWLAMFSGLVLPAFMKGITGDVEIPPDMPKQTPLPIPKPKVVTDYARQYFQERGLSLVKTLTETDCNRLKVQMLDNWGKGEDFFKKSFQEDYANTKARLDTIYRTEYITAQNAGILARARDADHAYKRWNAALDERTCDVCGSQLHGVIIPIEEKFIAEFEKKNGEVDTIELDGPIAHVNCRCVLTTLSEDEYNSMSDEEIRQDARYLQDAFDFIKLNYKCKKEDSPDGSNKCRIVENKEKESSKKNLNISNKAIGPIYDSSGKMTRTALSLYMYQSESLSILQELKKYPNSARRKIGEFEIEKLVLEENPKFKTMYSDDISDSERRPLLLEKKELERKKKQELGFDSNTFNNIIVDIDNCMDKSRLEEPITVYSGTTEPFINSLPQNIGDEFILSTYISSSRLEKVGKGFAVHGATIGRAGVKAKEGAIPSMLKINLSKGQKAILLEDFTNEVHDVKHTKWIVGESGKPRTSGNQREVLINRNTRYRVDNNKIINGVKILEVTTI